MPARSNRKTPRWLEDDKILVADGGMGTTLFGLGLDNGDSPELWNVDFPDRIAGVHRAYVRRGPTSSSRIHSGVRHRVSPDTASGTVVGS